MIRSTSNRALAAAALVAAMTSLPLFASAVLAVNPTISVNSTADAVDANPGDGVCETATGNGVCTLRAAVMEANAFPGNDAIELGAATYSLSIPVTGAEPNAAFGDLNVTDTLTVFGQGTGSTTVEGSSTSWQDAAGRIFSTGSAAIGFNLFDMTIRRGHEGYGGAVSINATQVVLIERVTFTDNHADGLASGAGGAIYNWGAALTLANVSFTANHSLHGGGALVTQGTTTITDAVFRGNHSDGHAGAIWVLGSSNTTIARTEISENTAQSTSSGGLQVGTGSVSDDASVTVSNTTFSWNGGNSAVENNAPANSVLLKNVTIQGSAWSIVGPSISIQSSILANADQTNCGGWTITSLGHNVFDDASCAMVGTDIEADPKLGLLDDNGGPSRTHALLAGSPAVDAGASCPAVDQREVARPIDGNQDGQAVCDAGAFEAPEGTNGAPSPTPAPTTAPTSTPTATPTTAPTATPVATPTPDPTSTPTATETPTPVPTPDPTATPTVAPTPVSTPTTAPTETPGTPPTDGPTGTPTADPTHEPGGQPSDTPGKPSDGPGDPGGTTHGEPSDRPGDGSGDESDDSGDDSGDPGDDSGDPGDDSDAPELTEPPTDALGPGPTDAAAGSWIGILVIVLALGAALAADQRVTRRKPLA